MATCVVCLCGLPGAGKTTLAQALEDEVAKEWLLESGHRVVGATVSFDAVMPQWYRSEAGGHGAAGRSPLTP